MNDIWKYIITIIISIIIGFFIGTGNVTVQEVPVEVHDTVVVDSIRIEEHTRTIASIDTVLRIDTLILREDGTYVQLPMDFKLYKDSFITDSSKLELLVDYHGIACGIDSIKYTYDYYPSFKCPEEKKIRPFIIALAGPLFTPLFTGVKGILAEVGGGVKFKNNWGVVATYELNGNVNEISHGIKVGVIKMW